MSAELDPKVAALLDKYADKTTVSPYKEDAKDLSDDEDGLFAELERDDSAMDAFREKRMQQLHDEYGLNPLPSGGICTNLYSGRLTVSLIDWQGLDE